VRILRAVADGNDPDRIFVEHTSRCLKARGHTIGVLELPAPPESARGMRFGPMPNAAKLAETGPWDVMEIPQDCVAGLDSAPDWLPVVVRAPTLLGTEWEFRVRSEDTYPLLPGWWDRLRFPGKVMRPWADAMRAARVVFCSNETDRIYLTDRMGIPASRIVEIAAGTDNDQFGCGEHRLSEGSIPRLLWMGPWTERRGSESVKKAFAALRSEMPQIHLRIVGAGLDAEQLRDRFPEGDREGIEVEPDFSEAQRRAQYLQHDILIATAPNERFDPTVLEAAAAGMAMVLRDPDGPAPGFVPGTDFLQVPENNPDAVAAAVRRLINDTDLATRLRFSAVAKARTFPWSAVAVALESGYKQAVKPV